MPLASGFVFLLPHHQTAARDPVIQVLDHVLAFTYDTLIPEMEIKGDLGSTKEEVRQCHGFGMTGHSRCMEFPLAPHPVCLSPRVPFTSHPCSLSSGVPFGTRDEKLLVLWLGKQPSPFSTRPQGLGEAQAQVLAQLLSSSVPCPSASTSLNLGFTTSKMGIIGFAVCLPH